MDSDLHIMKTQWKKVRQEGCVCKMIQFYSLYWLKLNSHDLMHSQKAIGCCSLIKLYFLFTIKCTIFKSEYKRKN